MAFITSLETFKDNLSNSLTVGVGSKATKLKLNFSETHSCVEIGKNSNLTDTEIFLGKGSKLIVGDDSVLKGKISIGSFSTVIIGNKLSVTRNLYIRAVEQTQVKIGDDCLIASNVIIRTNDGHPIYDIHTSERINQSQDVIIHDHVWLGDESVILKGVTIHEGSIIAMRSLVTKDVQSCTVVAGIPAKTIRTDCTWEHDLKTKTERFYK